MPVKGVLKRSDSDQIPKYDHASFWTFSLFHLSGHVSQQVEKLRFMAIWLAFLLAFLLAFQWVYPLG